jgi:fibronectin-binding autotransporter adhesin
MYLGWTATGDGTVNINDGGTVNTPGIVFGPGTGRLNFDRADNYTFSAPISGGAAGRTSLTKNGTGTVTLSGTNTYAGANTKKHKARQSWLEDGKTSHVPGSIASLLN